MLWLTKVLAGLPRELEGLKSIFCCRYLGYY